MTVREGWKKQGAVVVAAGVFVVSCPCQVRRDGCIVAQERRESVVSRAPPPSSLG